tara:strand:- start:15 stop:833 length:819 start_codon:yes stop_codon:yes gene_type:complete
VSNADHPVVSFLIPARDRAAELKSALASCLCQSIEPWEAVVVDDHSSQDDLSTLVEGFNDSRLRYHRQKQPLNGVSDARNTAIALARSDRLITLDSDDINHPHRAARCVDLLEPDQPSLIYTRVCLFSRTQPSGRPKPILQPFSAPLLTMVNFITNPGTAFTRKAVERAGGGFRSDLTLAEDYDLYLRMARAGVQIRAVDEVHVSYRKHSKAVTAKRSKELHEAIMTVRRLNGVAPFQLEAIRANALPELCRNVLDNPEQRSLWRDDRWKPQ